MSDIKVGDLVVVVRWPCCGHYLGSVMRVEFFSQMSEDASCTQCGAKHGAKRCAGDAKNDFPVEWLKRIPPLEELEGEKREEKEPA